MKSALLVLLLAAAATAAVVSKELSGVVEVPNVDEVADVVEVYDVDKKADVVELTDAAEFIDEAEVPAKTALATRQLSLSQGNILSGDRRIHDWHYTVSGIAGANISRNAFVIAAFDRRISAIRVNRNGVSQGATVFIVAGGIGSASVTIGIRSAVGRGFSYRVEVYER